jgi:hypothetical protein
MPGRDSWVPHVSLLRHGIALTSTNEIMRPENQSILDSYASNRKHNYFDNSEVVLTC